LGFKNVLKKVTNKLNINFKKLLITFKFTNKGISLNLAFR